MPPNGLYTMAPHHLYGGESPLLIKRRSYNSKAFDELSDEPVTPQNNGARPEDWLAHHKTASAMKYASNEKKKRKHSSGDIDMSDGATPASSNKKDKKDKKARRESFRTADGGSVKKKHKSSKSPLPQADLLKTLDKHDGHISDSSAIPRSYDFLPEYDDAPHLQAQGMTPVPLPTHSSPIPSKKKKDKKKKRKSVESAPSLDLDLGSPSVAGIGQEICAESPILVDSAPRNTPVPLPEHPSSRFYKGDKAADHHATNDTVPIDGFDLSRRFTPINITTKPKLILLDGRTPVKVPMPPPPTPQPMSSKKQKKQKSVAVDISPPAKKSLAVREPSDDGYSDTTYTSAMSSITSTPLVIAPAKPYVTHSTLVKKSGKNKHGRVYYDAHEEGSLDEFTAAFRAAQQTVNFDDEEGYLAAHQNFQIAQVEAGPLPCLKTLSGCAKSGEKALANLMEEGKKQDDDSDADQSFDQNAFDKYYKKTLKALEVTPEHMITMHSASIATGAAARFLTTAITARIPVPLGKIEGIWHLFCPMYSSTHIDKYGFGQRTLTISSVPGGGMGYNSDSDSVEEEGAYFAKLSLPPRTMAFTLASFTPPPHASFRSTMLRTTAEGYAVHVTFIGNGYMFLRMDLSQLLKGRELTDKAGKQVLMEFVGIKQGGALPFEGMMNKESGAEELERVGKRLCRVYDG